jgi:hypothetical protein
MWHTERNFSKCVAKDEVFEKREIVLTESFSFNEEIE